MSAIVWYETRSPLKIQHDSREKAYEYAGMMARFGEEQKVWHCRFDRSTGTIASAVIKTFKAVHTEED